MILNLGLCHRQGFITFDEWVSKAHYTAGAVFKSSQKNESLNSLSSCSISSSVMSETSCAILELTPERLSFHTCACRALDLSLSSFPSQPASPCCQRQLPQIHHACTPHHPGSASICPQASPMQNADFLRSSSGCASRPQLLYLVGSSTVDNGVFV